MSFLNSLNQLAGALQTPPTGLVVNTWKPDDAAPWMYQNDNGDHSYFRYANVDSSLTAYRKCPPLSAIINRKGQSYINGKTWIMNNLGKESSSPEAKKLKKLLARPNPLQSWKQFEAQGYIYQQMFGFTMILPIKPVGFNDNIDATALWNIPPPMINIEETKKLWYQSDTNGIIAKIVLTYKGEKTILQAKDVYIMKDFTPSFDSLIIPESRIKLLEMPINNIIGAFECRNVLINYRGALGILTNDIGPYGVKPLDPDDKQQIQQDFAQYGLKNRQWKFIMTNAALKWQPMGVPTKDLMLFEEVRDSSIALCNGYNFPPFLLALSDSTYNNQANAEKGLYQNAIIPEAESNYEQWNNFFGTIDMNIDLQKDYSHLPILQENELEKARARKERNAGLIMEFEMGLITMNRWRELNGEDTVSGQDITYTEALKQGLVTPRKTVNNSNQANNNEDDNNQNNIQDN